MSAEDKQSLELLKLKHEVDQLGLQIEQLKKAREPVTARQRYWAFFEKHFLTVVTGIISLALGAVVTKLITANDQKLAELAAANERQLAQKRYEDQRHLQCLEFCFRNKDDFFSSDPGKLRVAAEIVDSTFISQDRELRKIILVAAAKRSTECASVVKDFLTPEELAALTPAPSPSATPQSSPGDVMPSPTPEAPTVSRIKVLYDNAYNANQADYLAGQLRKSIKGSSPTTTKVAVGASKVEVRYYHDADQKLAEDVSSRVSKALGQPASLVYLGELFGESPAGTVQVALPNDPHDREIAAMIALIGRSSPASIEFERRHATAKLADELKSNARQPLVAGMLLESALQDPNWFRIYNTFHLLNEVQPAVLSRSKQPINALAAKAEKVLSAKDYSKMVRPVLKKTTSSDNA